VSRGSASLAVRGADSPADGAAPRPSATHLELTDDAGFRHRVAARVQSRGHCCRGGLSRRRKQPAADGDTRDLARREGRSAERRTSIAATRKFRFMQIALPLVAIVDDLSCHEEPRLPRDILGSPIQTGANDRAVVSQAVRILARLLQVWRSRSPIVASSSAVETHGICSELG
jgi:hypothetical protein